MSTSLYGGISANILEDFFILLRSGLYGSAPEGVADSGLSEKARGCTPKGFTALDAEGWRTLKRLAGQQTVSGIIFTGLSTLPDDLLPPENLMLQWIAQVEAIECHSRRIASAQNSLLAFFAEQGLRPVVQKGSTAAAFYPSPWLRESGDIDLYFAVGWDEALKVLEEKGISLHKESDGSVSYRWHGILVEHHPFFLDVNNPLKKKALKEIESQYGPDSPLMTLLLLSSHILKHCLGRGVGLRQFCDFAVASKSLMPIIPEGEFEKACSSLGLRKWNELLQAFVNEYLGGCPSEQAIRLGDLSKEGLKLNSCNAGMEKDIRHLLSLVLEGGNFGQHRQNRNAAGSATDAASGTVSHWRRQGGTTVRKLSTFTAFCRNFAFAPRIAPMEYFGTMARLLKGQFVVRRK